VEEQRLKDIFQEKLGGHQAPVSPELWSQLSSKIPAAGSGAASGGGLVLSSTLKAVITAAFVVAAVSASIYLLNQKENSQEDSVPPSSVEKEVQSPPVKSEAEEVDVTESKPLTTNTALDPTEKSESASPKNPTISEEASTEPLGEKTATDHELNRSENSDHKTTEDHTQNHLNYQDSGTDELESNDPVGDLQEEEAESSESIEYNADCSIGSETPMILQYSVEPESKYLWDFGDGNKTEGTSGSYRYSSTGHYTVRLFELDSDGQNEIKSWEVDAREKPVVVLPNVFTPFSSPGSNDFYRLDQGQSQNIEFLNIRIFSKDGELVYESSDPDFSWDGKDRYGKQLSPGMYLAVAEARNSFGDKTVEQQTIYLKR
jgi:hypothetical protein